MKKKLVLFLSFVVMTLGMMAVPAKRGLWKNLKLADGTEVRAQLVGDEHGHYWVDNDGKTYLENEEDVFQKVDAEVVKSKAKAHRQKANALHTKRLAPRKVGEVGSYIGQKKGIIILVNFSNVSFNTTNAYFKRVVNEENFSDGDFKGSMYDYFKAQSDGKFELKFDVVGPVTVSKTQSYYGKNDSDGNDMYPGTMVIEALKLADSQVNYADYDWDGDGYVDQVYVVYAGKGEADGGASSTIWPHAYTLAEAKIYGDGSGVQTLDGVKIDTYACGAELNGQTGDLAGIGTMCHEFSHCLGYPDFYDTDYSGGQGMFEWDLMDSGSYNDDGYRPAGYTSYERWVAGWREPIELTTTTEVNDLKATELGGESYIIYNKGNQNEYYLLENRQKTGWDTAIPGKGLLIIHVDYNATIWNNNTPNDDPSHQRMTWIAADNKYQYEMWNGSKYYTTTGAANDPFPYGSKNSFDKNTTPAAKFYNKNIDGTYYMDSSIQNIKRNTDGTVSFKFIAAEGEDPDPVDPDPVDPDPVDPDPVDPDVPVGDVVFYESFDNCASDGGNDGVWNAITSQKTLASDNNGWASEKGFAANKCARFGTSGTMGNSTTPSFTLNGEATLSFKAGAWNGKSEAVEIGLSATGGSLDVSTITLVKGEWRDYKVNVNGNGSMKISFNALTSNKPNRFFLDEVKVVKVTTDGINGIDNGQLTIDNGQWYDLQGRKVMKPTRGLYIVNGKKVVLR